MNELVRRMAFVGLHRVPAFRQTSTKSFATLTHLVHNCSSAPSGNIEKSSRYGWSMQRMNLSTLPAPSTSESTNSIVTDEESGKHYGVLHDTRQTPKLKPGVVQKRLAKCKTYIGREAGIRQSPWKLNRVCQLAAGLTLEEALTQLKFCDIKNASLVAKVLKRTSNLADIRDGIQISQLEVAECFTTKSMMLKRVKPMGRGRAGVMHHKFSNIRVVLREIDFPLRIYQQKSLNQKKKWLHHQQRSEKDAQAARSKREELRRLEQQQEEQLMERKGAQNS